MKTNIFHRLRNLGGKLPLLLGCLGLLMLVGCQEIPPAKKGTAKDLLNLSSALETQEFRLTEDPEMKPVALVVANSTDAAGGHGNYGEIARTDINEIFSNCKNYVVANRSVNRQAAAELKLGESTGGRQSVSAPVTPQFMLKATVMQVERETKSDGTKTTWQYILTAETAKAKRQGAVEVLVEVIALDKLTTLFATRSYALLYDQTKESSLALPVISGAQKSSTRVPERQAIRTACQEAAQKTHDYLRSLSRG